MTAYFTLAVVYQGALQLPQIGSERAVCYRAAKYCY